MSQISTLLKKNAIQVFRSGEIFIDVLIPVLIAMMLSLKVQLGIVNTVLPIVYVLAISGTTRSIMIQLVEEKSQRYKETQKIMGMTDSAYIIGWFITAYVRMTLALVSFICSQLLANYLTGLTGTNWSNNYTVSFSELMGVYVLYGYTSINQSFFFASLFQDSRIASEFSTFFTVAFNFFVFMTFMPSAATSFAFYVIISIFSPQVNTAFSFVAAINDTSLNTSLNFFPSIISTYTQKDAAVQLSVMYVLYLIFFFYFDQIISNDYGVAKHPLFFIDYLKAKDPIKKVNKNISLLSDQDQQYDSSSAMYHEPYKIDNPPSIIISQLIKEFNNMRAVNDLSLQLYESQIFCLLGHNGAGKTTTLSLLTGMIDKTSGYVEMYSLNLDNDLNLIRKSLGLCTQKDCLYDNLTVQEHLLFIGNIKGGTTIEKVQETLNMTDLDEERDKVVSELSGGSKRKLSLAMALMGDSKVLFLDEPTSGMDAFSRRAIWNILERVKVGRTIILTTHHLDEAEILADRIGIMSKGQLLAVGTSEFIRKKFGEGYNLKLIVPSASENIKASLQTIISQYIPDHEKIDDQCTHDQLTFLIPFKSKIHMGDVFREIEQGMPEVQISMQMNTLEDAFIKIGQEEDRIFHQHQMEQLMKTQSLEMISEYKTQDHHEQEHQDIQIPSCLSLPPSYSFIQQTYAIFLRRVFTTIRTNTNYLALMIPIITFALGIMVSKNMILPQSITNKLNPSQQTLVSNFFQSGILACVCVIGFSFNSTVYITLPVMERENQLKDVLHGMGCRFIPYWLGTLLFDLIIYYSLIMFYFAMAFILDLNTVTDNIWQTLFVFGSFSLSYIMFSYVCGFLFNKIQTALKYYSLFNYFVMFCVPFIILAMLSALEFYNVIKGFQALFMCISPFWTLFEAYSLVIGKSNYSNASEYFAISQNTQPAVIISMYYWVYCFALLGQSVLFMCVLFILEKRHLKSSNVHTSNINEQSVEIDVYNEINRVISDQVSDRIQAQRLQKKYSKDGPDVLQEIYFGVKRGEIFGLIGPNGAGKSTILNTLTGITLPSGGMAMVDNQSVTNKDMNVLGHIGICPQFDCIWENLTAIEHLRLFGRIKGLSGNNLEEAVNYFIITMQLTLFKNTKAGQMSGGNKRKLCVSDALIGGSDITFFDEPSTGVDPISRRFLLNTLKRNVQLRNCSAILTTHTIEEAELLSERIGIIVDGKFMCIGTPEYLRKTYGSGYQVSIQVFGSPNEIMQNVLNTFKSSKFMAEKRMNYATFSLSDEGFSFFKTFQYFENLKKSSIIEDYSINQNSLETVFLHFSKNMK